MLEVMAFILKKMIALFALCFLVQHAYGIDLKTLNIGAYLIAHLLIVYNIKVIKMFGAL